MKYFKNTELAKLYNISEKSVRNWIDATQAGKLQLQLHTEGSKTYIANVSKNAALIEQLVAKGKKYKNARGHRVVAPLKPFYDTYSEKQILDILSNVTIHHEIPLHYSYADGGAAYWDGYAKRLGDEEHPNILNRTIELLDISTEYMDRMLASHKRINVVDLGPGNGLPIRQLLAHLEKSGKLNRYIAIDSSKEMLNILGRNIDKWFDSKVQYEGYVRDITYEQFDDLLTHDQVDEEGNMPVNLVLFLGNTLNNFRVSDYPLRAINSSMNLNDILIYSGYLDTPLNRRYFDFTSTTSSQKLRTELILSSLGIDSSLYDMEQRFDETKRARLLSIRPKVDVTIKFELGNGVRYLELLKNQPILLGRICHRNSLETLELFERSEFESMYTSKSIDHQYELIICTVKTDHAM